MRYDFRKLLPSFRNIQFYAASRVGSGTVDSLFEENISFINKVTESENL